jgi:hypothetical protein
MLMQEWAGCLFDVLAMAQPDDRVIREKAKVPRVEAQPSRPPAQIYCRSVIYLATESLIDISDAGPTASHHFRIVRTQQISCRFTVHSRHLSYLSRSLFPSKHKRRVQLGESCNVYCQHASRSQKKLRELRELLSYAALVIPKMECHTGSRYGETWGKPKKAPAPCDSCISWAYTSYACISQAGLRRKPILVNSR